MSFHAKIARRLKRTLRIITLHFALVDCKRLRCISKICCLGQTELFLNEMENNQKLIKNAKVVIYVWVTISATTIVVGEVTLTNFINLCENSQKIAKKANLIFYLDLNTLVTM